MTEQFVTRKQLDMNDLHARLAQGGGKEYWRSLDELAETEEFEELLHREFPESASEWADGVSRRNFLKLMGASLAFGGLTNCTIQPEEKIVPWVRAPENLIPGKPLFYATAVPLSGVGTGILVESHMGRPTKIEGNPGHPASLGGTDAITQASILDLYDPDRATAVKNAGRISTWSSFLLSLDKELALQRLKNGAGLRILTETVGSPSLGQQLGFFLEEFPEAHWHQYEPANRDNVRIGAALAFGEPVNTYFDIAKADVILSLDADFLYSGPGSVRYARDFASRRRLHGGGKQEFNRLYVVETSPSSTGSMADHRVALDSGSIEAFALALAGQLGVKFRADGEIPPFNDPTGWLAPLARDLRNAGSSGLVVAGAYQSPTLHALAHAINDALGNVGTTVHYTDPLEVEPVDESESLRELVTSMKADEVEVLIIVGGNPVFNAPADLDFAEALGHVGFRAQLSPFEDETSALCHWHVPESHYLESWSDIRSHDGTAAIVQPLIQPLYNSKSAHELVGAMIGQPGLVVRDLLREFWQQETFAPDFEEFWVRALHDGVLADMAFYPRRVSLRTIKIATGFATPIGEEQMELALRPDPLVWDGRFVNNGWLQETPKPVTELTWDNAALMSPKTAQRLGVKNEQVVELSHGGRSVRAPVWIVPGQARDVVTVHLGYGRRQSGRVGKGTGFNAYAVRTSSSMWGTTGLKVIKSFDRHALACTQDHQLMEGRHLVRHADLEHYRHHPDFAQHEGHVPPASLTLFNNDEFQSSTGNSWGMAIDLNACIGCNACAVACQAENNIPIVGKDEVLNGREMSWIRIDRYYAGDLDDPEILHQPIPCQQCENAPCELVCPVGATVHSEEGLNDMVYNRCVGTRYCSNNCPYKVRRFNYLQYADRDTPSLKPQRNPDVTVRSRGVMEKCTYCTQRINAARIVAKKRGAPIQDGEIQTACQQVCPTEAIVFGNIQDENSRVSKWKDSSLNYSILPDLNTRPRTTYLARVKNPNPEIKG